MAKMNWSKVKQGEQNKRYGVEVVGDTCSKKTRKKLWGKPDAIAVQGRYCPKCHGSMRVQNGKNGPFLACMNYPNCNGTLSMPTSQAEPQTSKPTEATQFGSYQQSRDLQKALQAVKPDESIWVKFSGSGVDVYVENWHPELLGLWVDAVRSTVKPPAGQELTQVNFHHFAQQGETK